MAREWLEARVRPATGSRATADQPPPATWPANPDAGGPPAAASVSLCGSPLSFSDVANGGLRSRDAPIGRILLSTSYSLAFGLQPHTHTHTPPTLPFMCLHL